MPDIFTGDIFKCIFMKNCISIRISLQFFFPTGPIDNNTALVQVVVWCMAGDELILLKDFIIIPIWSKMEIIVFIKR